MQLLELFFIRFVFIYKLHLILGIKADLALRNFNAQRSQQRDSGRLLSSYDFRLRDMWVHIASQVSHSCCANSGLLFLELDNHATRGHCAVHVIDKGRRRSTRGGPPDRVPLFSDTAATVPTFGLLSANGRGGDGIRGSRILQKLLIF